MLEYKDYVYAVYQERSFSKAAQKLYVSQPWLSSVVKKVEQRVKAPLFDRTTNPISLTEAGRYYMEQAEKVRAIEEEMRQYFSDLEHQQGSSLHIGSSMFFCTYVLPHLMEEFREMHPNITLTFSEGDSQSLQEKLLGRKLDFILEVEQCSDSAIASIPWAREEIVLAVPAKWPINRQLSESCYTFDEFLHRQRLKKPPVPLSAFRDEPFLLLKPGNDIYERSMAMCRSAGVEPKTTVYLTQMMTAYYLTCEGQGVSFLRSTIPEYVAPTESVVFYQLEDALAQRNIYLSYHKKGVGAVGRKLLDFMDGKHDMT